MTLWLRLLNHFSKCVAKEKNCNPQLFLMQMVILRIYGNLETNYQTLVCWMIFLVFKINTYWICGLLLNSLSTPMTILNIVLGLLTCNNPMNSLLFLYSLLYLSVSLTTYLKLVINFLSFIIIMVYVIYRLPLTTHQKNFSLFRCLLILLCFTCFQLLKEVSGQPTKTFLLNLIIFVPLTLLISKHICDARLLHLQNQTIQTVKSSTQMINYIREEREKAIDRRLKGYNEVLSSCHLTTESQAEGMYQRAMLKYECPDKKLQILREYIEFLLEARYYLRAVEEFLIFQRTFIVRSFYSQVILIQIRLLLENYLIHIEDSYEQVSYMQQLVEYDLKLDQLDRKINDLIDLKTSFWMELLRESCNCHQINKITNKFLKDLNSMHQFYIKQLKGMEMASHTFRGSMQYNIFLITVTNYTYLAKENIKNIQRLINGEGEDVSSDDYYVIQASMESGNLGQIKNYSKDIIDLLKFQEQNENLYGWNVQKLIPEPFLKEHRRGMLDDKTRRSGLVGSKMVPTYLLSQNQTLVSCNMTLRYGHNHFNQLTIISIFQISADNYSEEILVDLEGFYLNGTLGSQKLQELLTEQRLVEELDDLKERWLGGSHGQSYPPLEPVKLTIETSLGKEQITVSSPFSQYFEKPSVPPLHLKLVDKQAMRCLSGLGNKSAFGMYMNRLTTFMDQNDQSSCASTEACRPSDTIRILQGIEKASDFKVFTCMYSLILLVFVASITVMSSIEYLIKVEGVAQNSKFSSNRFEILNALSDLQGQMLFAMSEGLTLSALNSSKINQQAYINAYNYSDGSRIRDQISLSLHSHCTNIRDNIVNNIMSVQSSMEKEYTNLIRQRITVITRKSVQETTTIDLIDKFVTDCYDLRYGAQFEQLPSANIFWDSLFDKFDLMIETANKLNKQRLESSHLMNILLFSLSTLLFLLFLVPLYLANRKLKNQENYIYELLVTIEPMSIVKEIENLELFQRSLEEKSASNKIEHLVDNISQKDLLQMQGFRRRQGTLNFSQLSRHRLSFLLLILIIIAGFSGLFICKQHTINVMIDTIDSQYRGLSERNMKVSVLVNLKKYLFDYYPDKNFTKQKLKQWLDQNIRNLRINRQIDYDSCQATGSCLKSEETSEAIADSMFISFASQTLVKNYTNLLPHLDNLSHLGYYAYALKELNRNKGFYQSKSELRKISQVLFYVLVFAFFNLALIFLLYVRKLKINFINMLRSISLLNEQMVRSNRRVNCYLQRLQRSQN